MPRILVTGGAGFIGSNFVHYWIGRYPADRVVVIDALTYSGRSGNLDDLRPLDNFRFVEGDIVDEQLIPGLLRDESIDTIVNFAAETHVDRSISEPAPFLRTNILGTHTLLRAARDVWTGDARDRHRFHHISTDEVYGSLEPHSPPASENTPYAPNSPYSASKAAADHIVRAYHQTYGLKATTSHCSNNYGPFQHPEKLIPKVIVNSLSGIRIPIYGDGRHVRDWLHVRDHCRGIELILQHGSPGERYNIGADSAEENRALVRGICSLIDEAFADDDTLSERFPDAPPANGEKSASLIEFVEDRPGHDRRYALDTGKMAERLGFWPAVSLTTGLRQTVTWYLQNEHWWRESDCA